MVDAPQITLGGPARADVEAAIRDWKANCGPTAIAAATGRSMAQVKDALSRFGRFKGHTAIADIQDALRWLDVRMPRVWSKPSTSLLLSDMVSGPAIFMVQWGGPWMSDPRIAAAYRHLIAFKYGWAGDLGPRWIADINNPDIWATLHSWERDTLPSLLPHRGDGTWTVSWAGQIESEAA